MDGSGKHFNVIEIGSDALSSSFKFIIFFFFPSPNLSLLIGTNFTVENSTLSLWEASLGSSYMCKKEQSFNITDALVLNTFELQVQPFAVMNDQFSTGKI